VKFQIKIQNGCWEDSKNFRRHKPKVYKCYPVR